MAFFDIFHDDRAKHGATFGSGVWFQKNNPGISMGSSVRKLGIVTFSRKCYYEFF